MERPISWWDCTATLAARHPWLVASWLCSLHNGCFRFAPICIMNMSMFADKILHRHYGTKNTPVYLNDRSSELADDSITSACLSIELLHDRLHASTFSVVRKLFHNRLAGWILHVYPTLSNATSFARSKGSVVVLTMFHSQRLKDMWDHAIRMAVVARSATRTSAPVKSPHSSPKVSIMSIQPTHDIARTRKLHFAVKFQVAGFFLQLVPSCSSKGWTRIEDGAGWSLKLWRAKWSAIENAQKHTDNYHLSVWFVC
jgi:hypothetical protein